MYTDIRIIESNKKTIERFITTITVESNWEKTRDLWLFEKEANWFLTIRNDLIQTVGYLYNEESFWVWVLPKKNKKLIDKLLLRK